MPDPFTVAGLYTRTVYTVATLPSPVGANQGNRVMINDANESPYTSFGKIATGGGQIRCLVQSDGITWRYAP